MDREIKFLMCDYGFSDARLLFFKYFRKKYLKITKFVKIDNPNSDDVKEYIMKEHMNRNIDKVIINTLGSGRCLYDKLVDCIASDNLIVPSNNKRKSDSYEMLHTYVSKYRILTDYDCRNYNFIYKSFDEIITINDVGNVKISNTCKEKNMIHDLINSFDGLVEYELKNEEDDLYVYTGVYGINISNGEDAINLPYVVDAKITDSKIVIEFTCLNTKIEEFIKNNVSKKLNLEFDNSVKYVSGDIGRVIKKYENYTMFKYDIESITNKNDSPMPYKLYFAKI